MKTIEEKKAEYLALTHAMQSGVAYTRDKSAEEPKHLRTGINSAHAAVAGLAGVLIAKGMFTVDEYWDFQIKAMQEEVYRYRQEIADQQGVSIDKITLG